MHRYHLSRNGKVLGIYPEDKITEYFAEGRVGPNDLVWREGMDGWLPAWQVFGGEDPHAAAALPPLTPEANPAQDFPVPANKQPAFEGDEAVPPPPKLHWGWVLLLTLVTFG